MASKQGFSHGRVLVNCDHTLKSHLNLEKVIPKLVERKVLPRKMGKHIRKTNDRETFLAIMKSKPMSDFLIFLEVLQSFSKQDKDTDKLIKIMATSLKDVVTTDDAIKSTISSFIKSSEDESPESKKLEHGMTEIKSQLANISVCSSPTTTLHSEIGELTTSMQSPQPALLEEKSAAESGSSNLSSITQLPPKLPSSPPSVTYTQVLTDCDHAMRQHLHLEKVVPELIARKVIAKRLGKLILKTNDKEMFIGFIKKQPIETFMVFLNVLASVSKDDKETHTLVRKMGGPVDEIKTSDTEIQRTISNFVEASQGRVAKEQTSEIQPQVVFGSDKSTLLKTELSPPDTSTASAQAILQPHRPPPGFIGECKTRIFTCKGGMVYLSEHGVTVIIPSGAVPGDTTISMSVHAYLHGPFSQPDGVQLCSAIVWFGVQPPIEFQADVTVKLPHAAIIEEEASVSNLGVYRVPKENKVSLKSGQVYELTERIEGDFHDGYHAVFKVRHFSPYAVGKENVYCNKSSKSKHKLPNLHKVQKQTSSNGNTMAHRVRNFSERSQSSIESQASFEDSGSGNASPLLTKAVLKKDTTVNLTETPLPLSPPLNSNVNTCSACDTNAVADASITNKSGKPQSGGAENKLLVEKKGSNSNKVDGIKFCIAHCMPGDRSTELWECLFAVSYNHPTGIGALKRFTLHQYGKGFQMFPKKIRFTEDELKLTPEKRTSDDNHWTVSANETPELSIEDVLNQLPSRLMLENPTHFYEETVDFLPQITYTIQALTYPPPSPLKRRIDVHGAVTGAGTEIFFTLRSTGRTAHGPRILSLKAYLYDETSEVFAALQCNSDFQLDIRTPDCVKFVADLSYQLAKLDAKILTSILPFEEYQNDALHSDDFKRISGAVHHTLTTWVIRNGSAAKLNVLKSLLKRANISISLHSTESSESQHILTEPNTVPIPCESPATFLLEVSEKIQYCWKPVGRLMGISKQELDVAERAGLNDLHEQSYFMLKEWMRRHGNDATYGILFKAIHCVWEHDPMSVNDAWCYSTHVAEELQQKRMCA